MPKIFHTGEYLYIEGKGTFPSGSLRAVENSQGGVPRLDIVWTVQPELALLHRLRPERIARADGTHFDSLLDAAAYLNAQFSATPVSQQSSSFYFNGVDQYLNLGLHPDLFVHNRPFTVAAWVFTRDAYGVIIAQGYGSYTGSEQTMMLGVHDLKANAAVAGEDSRSSSNVADGQWHHIALSYDPSAGNSAWRLFVDGVNVLSYKRGNRKRNTDLLVGAMRANSDNTGIRDFFAGYVDEVVITTGAWQEADIVALKTFGVAGHPRQSEVECHLLASQAKDTFPLVNNVIPGQRITSGTYVNGLKKENLPNFGITSNTR